MATILPIPSTRVSDLTIRQRLISQLQSDQVGLVQLETQISTGQRLNLPSDDPAAAQRGLQLKQVIQQVTQFQANTDSNQALLTTTDSALANVADLLNNIKGVAQSVSSATASDTQRAAAAQQVAQAVGQLVNIGNQQFNGRYLFAGSQTAVQPFSAVGGFVQYNGNESSLSSYADVQQLFATNVDGNSAFGTLSAGIQGNTDLNPVVNAETPLSDLRNGLGIAQGSIALSDGSQTSIIDLKSAATLGDVARLIEAHPPAGRQVTVDLTATGLNVSLDPAGGGLLTITEVGNGSTASELGIRQDVGTGTGPLVGTDLNPRLSPTTALADLLGVRATARLTSSGTDNDLVFRATQPSAASNGVTVSFVDNPNLSSGQETVAYNAVQKTLVFQVAAGRTTANDIVQALRNDPVAGAAFQAELVPEDSSGPSHAGGGAIDASLTALTGGGSGAVFDTTGLTITSGGNAYNVNFVGAQTVQDVLNAIDGSGAGVVASINAAGRGIDIRSRLSGADFSIAENGGTTAAQLGVDSFTASTSLNELNHGLGVHAVGATDFAIVRPDGSQIAVSVQGAKTIGDVLNQINNDPGNQNPANRVTAQLSANGNGIRLTTAAGAGTFQVLVQNSSQAAQDLGLVPAGSSTSAAPVVSGTTTAINGSDANPQEVTGVFNTLIRLQHALQNNDQSGIQRSLTLLGQNGSQLSLTRSELGVREQGLKSVQANLQTNATALKDELSKAVDVDLTQAISDFTAKQAAFQAALQTTATISKLTLLSFL